MIDKILRFLGIVATITLVALGAAVLVGGDWEALKAIRDARPDLAVAELRAESSARDARIAGLEAAAARAEALGARLEAAEAEIATLAAALAAADAEIATLKSAAAAETLRVDAALGARAAYGEAIRIAPLEGDGALAIAPGADGAPQVTLADTGTWRLLKADQ